MSLEKPQRISKNEFPPGAKIVDVFTPALKELFFIIKNKVSRDDPNLESIMSDFISKYGVNDSWIYYPWNNTVVHMPAEDIYFRLRTDRNQNLITYAEQERFRQIMIGIAGLSVGSGILKALVISGGPKKLRLADPDSIEVTNLNRINAKLIDVGMNKTDVSSREVWELDPFAEIDAWSQGLTSSNLHEFLTRDQKLDIFIDEMDNLALKIEARLICRKEKIPVMMATDNGDTVLLDVERFDQEPERQILNGQIGDLDLNDFSKIDKKEWVKLSTELIGPSYMTERLQRSILMVGNVLNAVPRLGATGYIAGAAISFAVRRIANGYIMPSGRYVISLEEKLIQGYLGQESIEKRQKATKIFEKIIFGNHG